MSERNVALVISVYRAVNENNLPTFLDLMHPEVELLTSGVYPDFKPAYRGHEGAADYWQSARGLWDNFVVEIKSCEPAGDRVLVLLDQHVEGREGIERALAAGSSPSGPSGPSPLVVAGQALVAVGCADDEAVSAVHHQWGHLFELEDDRIRRVTAYDSWEAGREAAGAESGVGGGA